MAYKQQRYIPEKSLARPWKETSYSDQELHHYTKNYDVQTPSIYSCKSLARSWKETSYSDQDLQHYTKTYGVKTTAIYSW
jgi:hypothetical protein